MDIISTKVQGCPVCPVCESERKPKEHFLSLLGAPARRALENNGITTLDQLSRFRKTEILNFHGMGKSTISQTRKIID